VMFGLITRSELDKILDERDREQKRALEEMAFESARWFDKLRSLYAQWVKRDAKSLAAQGDGTEEEREATTSPTSPPGRPSFPNSRRGF